MTYDRPALLSVLATGALLLLLAGCGSSSPGEDYQTLSADQAEQIEQDRRDRAAARSSEQPADSSVSPLVLAAAQTVAATVQRAEEDRPPADGSTDIATDSSSDQTPAGPADGASGGVYGNGNGSEDAASPVEVAGNRAAMAIQGDLVERTIKLLVPDRSFAVEGPDEALRISYDDFDLLKVLNMEPVPVDAVDHFPSWLRDLDGRRVRVRGFMYPTFQETDIPAFVLARDNQICCFGRNPKIYDLVEVTLADGETTDYIQGRPFDVVGIFHIDPEADGDELWQLYQMTDAVVIDQ